MKRRPQDALMFRPSGVKHQIRQTEIKEIPSLTDKVLTISNLPSREHRMKINA